jgi:ElaB/YqjD/DUF883 family membrane-anchored ribosome-binding protein
MVKTAQDNDIHETLDALRNDLDAVRHDLKNLASTAYKSGRTRAKDVSEEVTQQVSEAVEQVREQARSRPLTTAAVALGTGFLLGKLTTLVIRR